MIGAHFPSLETTEAHMNFLPIDGAGKQKSKTGISRVNYIKLINWFWDTVPYIKRCKAGYIAIFVAIVDEINRNKWQLTAIPYERVLEKACCSKQTYLKARKWLSDNKLLDVTAGKNGKQMAAYNLGEEVLKWTTGANSQVQNHPQTAVHNQAATSRVTVQISPQVAVHNQPHYYKERNLNSIKLINEQEFEKFYSLYGLDIGKADALQEWMNLSKEEKQKAMEHVPKYKAATPESYVKNPANYLKKKSFNDQVINRKNNGKNINEFKMNINTDGPREPI
jgi:hypothetical protein